MLDIAEPWLLLAHGTHAKEWMGVEWVLVDAQWHDSNPADGNGVFVCVHCQPCRWQ